MNFEDEIVSHLEKEGYHPRSSKHSDHQSYLIIRGLVEQCPILRQRAMSGEVVASLRHHQQVGHADWVIDIAIGTCAGTPKPLDDIEQLLAIRMERPVIIQIAIELKSILTEHGKARKNRFRDFNSFHGYAHEYHPNTVAGGFLLVNAADRFYSPLRPPDNLTSHGTAKKPARVVAKEAVDIFRSVHLRNSTSDKAGMEAVGVVVVEHDNINVHKNPAAFGYSHKPTQLAGGPAAIKVGDPLHYQSMFQRLCSAYSQRFS